MTSTKEGVNPLRPYYIPPRIGEQTETLPRANPFSNANETSTGYASKARDIFPDIDYNQHLDELSPTSIESIKQFIDELLWKYTSVLMAQPFEVAKTILQVRRQDDVGEINASAVETTRRPNIASPRLSLYNEVLFLEPVIHVLFIFYENSMMLMNEKHSIPILTQILMRCPISHPTLHTHQHLLAAQGVGDYRHRRQNHLKSIQNQHFSLIN